MPKINSTTHREPKKEEEKFVLKTKLYLNLPFHNVFVHNNFKLMRNVYYFLTNEKAKMKRDIY